MNHNNLPALEETLIHWGNIKNIPDDLTPLGFPGLTRQNLTDALLGFKQSIETLNLIPDFQPSPVSHAKFQVLLSNLRQYIVSHLVSNPTAHMSGFVILLEDINRVIFEWFDNADPKRKVVTQALNQQLSLGLGNLKTVEEKSKSILETHEALQATLREAQSASALVTKAKEQVQADEQAVAKLAAEIQTNKTQSIEDLKQIEDLVAELKDIHPKASQGLIDQVKLFQEFRGYRDQVDSILGDANRASMAGAFIVKEQSLKKPLERWTRVFVLTIALLVVLAAWIVEPFFYQGTSSQILLRLVLSAPGVWLAWFSARQFGFINRLREEYSFKAAAAMAFEGYKREARESSPELQALLLKTAITCFGDNPGKIFEARNNHASPVHQLIDHALVDPRTVVNQAVKIGSSS